MPFVTLKEAIKTIPKGEPGAIGAFNYHNIEYAQAIVAGAEAENSPAILMVSEMMAKYVGIEIMALVGKLVAEKASVPIAVMLDHGTDFELITQSINLGLSVMFDGSRLPFDENVSNTQAVVKNAHAKGVSVEGEIGSLGISEEGDEEYNQHFTKPEEALIFAEKTGVDVLAISVGNTHGLYQGEQRIDVPRIKVINDLVGEIPIVMHGGSDMDVNIVHDSIHAGIRKFNIATDLRVAYSETMLKTLSVSPIPNAPPKVFTPVKDAVQKVVQQKIRIFSLKD